MLLGNMKMIHGCYIEQMRTLPSLTLCHLMGSAPNHHPNDQRWHTVLAVFGNKPQRNFNENTKVFFSRKCTWFFFCNIHPGLDVKKRYFSVAGLPPEKLVEAHGTFATATCIKCREPYNGEDIKVIHQRNYTRLISHARQSNEWILLDGG